MLELVLTVPSREEGLQGSRSAELGPEQRGPALWQTGQLSLASHLPHWHPPSPAPAGGRPQPLLNK